MPAAIIDATAHGALPDVLKSEYTKQADGNFLLNVTEGLGKGYSLENTQALRTALEQERFSRSELAKEAKKWAGLDPEVARDAQRRLDEMSKWTPEEKVQAKIDAQVKQVETKFTTEKQQLEARANTYKSQAEKLLVDYVATDAITKLGGNATLLMPHVQRLVRVEESDKGEMTVRVINPDGTPRITQKSGQTGPMSLEELVSVMRNDPIYKPCFSAGVKGGTGESGSQGDGAVEGRVLYITSAEARDHGLYKARKEQAQKAGLTLMVRE